MTDTLSRILKIVLAILIAVSFALTFWFYFTASGIDSSLEPNTQIDQFGSVLEYYVDWTYLLLIIAAGGTILFAVLEIVLNPKGAVKTLIPIAALGVVAFIAYSSASSEIMHLPNYDGTGNEPVTLKWAGTSLFAMYILFALAFGAIVVSEVSKIFK